MSNLPVPLSAEDLLAQSQWVRALARALLGDVALAEDAAQEAYVKVLEQPRRVRSVRSFFAALIANFARSEVRSRVRRVRREQIAALSEVLPSTDAIVQQEAARRDVVERVLALAEPYRTVVLLRFWADLAPSEIGRRLSVPASTVRTQLQRALAQLSRDLDREHGGDGRAWIVALAPFAKPTSVAGGALVLVGIAAAIVLTIAAAVAWWPRPVPLPIAPPRTIAAVPAASTAVPEPKPLARTPQLAAIVTGTLDGDGGDAIVRGRCVAEASGAPLAGCRVKFTGLEGNRAVLAIEGPVTWHDPDPIVTGEDGRFEFRFVPAPAYQHMLDVQCDAHAPRTARWRAFEREQIADLGDVPLAPGYLVHGRVVDAAGQPIRAVGVSVRDLPLPLPGYQSANKERGGLSGEDGAFTIDAPIPSGTWLLAVSTSAYELIGPTSVTVGDVPVEVMVVVKARRVLEGIVVDQGGAPVARARLWVRGAHDAPARTRDDGTFHIEARTEASDLVQLETPAVSPDDDPCEPIADDRLFAWGTTDIRLVVRRRLALDLTVVEAGTDTPVADYAVQCELAQEGPTWHSMTARLGGPHAGGHVIVDRLRRGRNVLRVIPKDRALGLSEDVVFDVGDDAVPSMRVELVRPTPVTVRVVAMDDSPVVGTNIEFVLARGAEIMPGTRGEDPRGGTLKTIAGTTSPVHVPLVVSRAATNSAGIATVYAPAAPELWLIARGARHRTVVRDHFAPPDDGSVVEVRVDAAGTLRGRLTGPALGAYAELGIVLWPHPNQLDDRGELVTADGTFEVQPPHPGDYSVLLAMTLVAKQQRRFLLPPLATVHVGASDETIELDTSPFAPVSVDAPLHLDAALLDAARITLHGLGGSFNVHLDSGAAVMASQWSVGPMAVEADGHLRVAAIPPGPYTAVVDFGGAVNGWIETLVFAALPGANISQPIELPRLRLRLHVLSSDTQPVANTACELFSNLPFSDARRFTTDAEGWITLDPAPAVPITLQIDNGAGGHAGPVQIPASDAEASFELTLVK